MGAAERNETGIIFRIGDAKFVNIVVVFNYYLSKHIFATCDYTETFLKPNIANALDKMHWAFLCLSFHAVLRVCKLLH